MDIHKLMQQMHVATDEEKSKIVEEVKTNFSTLSDSEKELVRKEFLESLDKKIDEAKIILEKTDIAIAISEISKYVSLSQISKTYFGKSKEWLYQRIKGQSVNGKKAEFTPNDREKLADALKNIGTKLIETSLKIT